ncbi:MAG TPA: phosphate acyltransferase PlsX [Anaerohalosphaeraceae bacterium]|jgi:glycerol-3-phosphate acyltransferase PlsX|nr:phosphate acyltransferase PlsX [Anaerohalosphaeraceae bacterium]HQG05211.1 phosphate acyltransferase PlsX [Anaerohalosphaeraceae bacterium]HQI06929.1 phosphate acyltransferase PlsX [Anaerohalosphaeraceae bacterium]HQJ66625.1 phosphate acyltransferase PlsX [Anaerohalosphaeraceae bacterium]
MRIAIDAMGGDYAPAEIIAGALEAKEALGKEDEIILIGDEAIIQEHLVRLKAKPDTFRIFHAPEVIGMNESPVEAIRHKKKSSIAIMARAASHRQVDAVLSAGNTGACVAACQLRMRNLEGVLRPGIATVFPTLGGPVVVCDVGANIVCKPIHLYQYAVMSCVYAEEMLGISNPRVGIMNIGEEEAKGNDLVKKTRALLKADPRINFAGNLEGRDIFEGHFSVVVCEGFVGNVVLKTAEGLVNMIFRAIKDELKAHWLLALQFKKVMSNVFKKYDYNEYGGALLLGVNGTAVICHGSSRARTIKNAILASRRFSTQRINEKIVQRLSQSTVFANAQ